jgi:adenylate kinase family enzyme
VALLGPDDPLPPAARRILVSGTSGSGKTTLARAIGTALAVPCVEIDALHHGPGWTVLPTFEQEVDRFSAGPGWVTEWQYSAVKPLLLERADLLVWLDHSRATVMRRVVRRTLVRRARRQELWNGNVEPPLWTFFTDHDHIVRWAWRTHRRRGHQALEVAADPDPAMPDVVRLSGQRQVNAWLAGPLAAACHPSGPIQS